MLTTYWPQLCRFLPDRTRDRAAFHLTLRIDDLSLASAEELSP